MPLNTKKAVDPPAETPALRERVITRRPFQIAAFIMILVLSVVLFSLAYSRLDLRSLLAYGYSGVFLINLLCAATILLPIPGEAMNIAAGATLNPLWLGLIASSGATIGELTSYYAGHMGRKVILSGYSEQYKKAESWLNRYGNFAVFLFALLPILIFDLLGIAAGSLRFPLWKFILFCWLGRLIRCLVQAYLGYGIFGFLPQWW
ncbi:VTT domain-containing protein [Chloroflexota bacterium]